MDNLQDDFSIQESQEVCAEDFTANIPQQDQKEKIQSQSDIFKVHFKRKRNANDNFDIICNYCGQNYKFKSGGGYGTFRRHVMNYHPTQIRVEQK